MPRQSPTVYVPIDSNPNDADQYIDALIEGDRWALGQDRTLTYSFPDSASDFYYTGHGFADGFNATQIAIVEDVLDYVSTIVDLNFEKVGSGAPGDDGDGTLRFFETNANAFAFAYLPHIHEAGGDSGYQEHFFTFAAPGEYAHFTFMHEIGHALGLKHGHENTPHGALPPETDSNEYSIMTYRNYVGQPDVFDFSATGEGSFAQSYMMYDIAALQFLYGPKWDASPTDTSYRFDQTTGQMFVNGAAEDQPWENKLFRTIWDGGGEDTYDLSNFQTNMRIDLRPGEFSDLHLGGNNLRAQISDPESNPNHPSVFAVGHIANAFQFEGDPRSLIENAIGGSSNDVIIGNAAENKLSGGAGRDILFADDDNVAAAEGLGGAVYRLYQATLDRTPDKAGFKAWVERLLTQERTFQQVAEGFVESSEFQNDYGNLNNQDFVTLLYQNVLDREPEAAGLANWTGALDSGVSRANVVVGFSNSQEFRNNTQQASDKYTENLTVAGWVDDVFRLYQATLDRAPDLQGLMNWSSRLADGQAFLKVVEGFVNSQEFQNTYGALSNGDFVELLYQNVLDRAPDPGGFNTWTTHLNNGVSRAQVVAGFSQSAEFKESSKDALKAWVQDKSSGDILDGGSGGDQMLGGALIDTFVIRAGDGGTDTVYNLESWDMLRFEDFGATVSSTPFDHFSQQGSNVVFEAGGNRVVIDNFQLSDLSADMFEFV